LQNAKIVGTFGGVAPLPFPIEPVSGYDRDAVSACSHHHHHCSLL